MNSEELREAYAEVYPIDVPDRIERAAARHQEIVNAQRKQMNSYEMVKEFHETFGHPVSDEPTVIYSDRTMLRLELIREEFCELLEAAGFSDTAEEIRALYLNPDVRWTPDLVGIADALGDLEYVVNGAALEHGINLPEVVREIHRSNMTKLGPDGKPIYREDGKILKGEGYEQPDLEKVLGL